MAARLKERYQKEVRKKVQDEFSNGTTAQSLVAVKADADAPATRHAIAALKAKTVAAGIASDSIDTEVNAAHTVTRVDIPLVGQGTDDTSLAALKTLREDIIPATVGKLDGAEYGVTGPTATSADSNALLKAKARLWWAIHTRKQAMLFGTGRLSGFR